MLPIVGLPGLLCRSSVFDGLRQHRLLAAMRAIELPDDDDFGRIAASIADDIDDGTILVGMSMGSYLCYEILRIAPGRIAGVVLVGTQSAADSPEAAAMRARSAAWARKAGTDALAGVVSDQMLGPTARRDPTIRARIAEMAASIGVDTFARHQAALAGRPDATPSLGNIACPVLVLNGEHDTVTPPEAGRAVADAVADGRFEPVADAGHLPLLEAPAAVASQVGGFVASITRTERVAV